MSFREVRDASCRPSIQPPMLSRATLAPRGYRAGQLASLQMVPRTLRASRHGYQYDRSRRQKTAFSSALHTSGQSGIIALLEEGVGEIRDVVLISCLR